MSRLVQAFLAPTLVAGILGVLVGIVFLAFEFIVKEGTQYLWNDVFNTDEIRWIVVPLTIVLSLIFGLALKLTSDDRVVPIHTDPTQHKMPQKVTTKLMASIFFVGALSLLAGASLGPEASLVALCSAMGIWLASKSKLSKSKELLTLSGVGALLVVFFNSLVPAAVPLLILYKKYKRITFSQVLPPVISGLAAYWTLHLVSHKNQGWGEVPVSSSFTPKDFLLALVLGFCASVTALYLKKFVFKLGRLTESIEQKFHWLAAAVIFGAVLGVLYLIGGQSVQFSGSEGSVMLINDYASHSSLALAALLVIKLAVTAWSLAAGYRGGIIFPSVYMGLAASAALATLSGAFSGPGIIIGSIAGILSAMTSPVLGFIMLISLLPLKLLGLAITGVIGAEVAQKIISSKQ